MAVQAVDDTLADGTQQATLTAQATLPPAIASGGGSTQAYMTRAVASVPDGRYVTAGLRYSGPTAYSFDIGVSRFLPDGQPDTPGGLSAGVYVNAVTVTDAAID